MSSWTSGYVTDIGYTYGYYAELNPLRLQIPFLNAGLEFPHIKNACELGFGQGVSINIHSASNQSTEWYGNDFNPSQAAFANDLSRSYSKNFNFSDRSFEEFCNDDSLPEFDYIGLHGIWSWVSDENRRVIVEFVKQKLSLGGVLYLSYNTMPGWSAAAPIRRLMIDHSDLLGSKGTNIVQRVDAALQFTNKILESSPLHALANPQIIDRFKSIKEQNRNYLAHEYFNRDWQPMYFTDVEKWLSPAKLTYACSSNYLDLVDPINLSEAQQELLTGISDEVHKQSVRDFLVNQQFRRDYWIKGPRKIERFRQLELIRNHKIMLTAYRPEITLKVNGSRGEANLSENIYNPILDFLADYKIHTIGELESSVEGLCINFAQLMQAVIVLGGKGLVYSVQADNVAKSSNETAKNLNNYLIRNARSTDEIAYLASPVIGGGFPVTRFQQLFLLAMQHGINNPDDAARFVWQIMSAQQQRLIKNGAHLVSETENINELRKNAEKFFNNDIKIFENLGIVVKN